jgi:hypothetical protein
MFNWEPKAEDLKFETNLGSNPASKKKKVEDVGGVSQVVQCLLRKIKAPSSNSTT